MNDDVDLTDIIADGDIKQIVTVLLDLVDKGYTKLYWDGYDSWIIALGEDKCG